MALQFHQAHPSWHLPLQNALKAMDPAYLQHLCNTQNWLPGPLKIFNAFSIPFEKTHYILWGESPYPRKQSANGYAFWDAAVHAIWSPAGFSKTLNRATSLRNFCKMLLVARGDLQPENTSQPAIASINKSLLINELDDLFQKLLDHGFLLLNSSLVLSERPVKQEAAFWNPFIKTLLTEISMKSRAIKLILFGQIAKVIASIPAAADFPTLITEHPYNLSFITNPKVLDFFAPFDLLTNTPQPAAGSLRDGVSKLN